MPVIVISPYSSDWPECFDTLREQLLQAFAPIEVSIEHVGSTSVPGLAAKPVIDVLLGARALVDIESKIHRLSELGYTYVSKYERELPMRRYFVKASATSPRTHLHAVERDSLFWREQLAFRDALRASANLRSRYQSLKLSLAAEFINDKSAYTAAKSPFIQSVLTTAFGNAGKTVDSS